MNDLDPTLIVIRAHHQNLIRQTQRAKLAREVKATQTNTKAISPLRAVLVAVINLFIKSF